MMNNHRQAGSSGAGALEEAAQPKRTSPSQSARWTGVGHAASPPPPLGSLRWSGPPSRHTSPTLHGATANQRTYSAVRRVTSINISSPPPPKVAGGAPPQGGTSQEGRCPKLI
ncbi:unnamed protein product [Lota lota]